MSSRSAQVIGLCEDAQQYTFFYRLLKALGFSRHQIDIKRAPVGEGAAEKWVRDRYPDEVEVYRRKSSHQNFGLLVAIDADTNPVKRRYRQFNEELAEACQDHRRHGEEICIQVPKREIETWIYDLLGHEVNETDKYQDLEKESECQPAVEKLVDHLRNDVPDALIPSLKRGCKELDERLPE